MKSRRLPASLVPFVALLFLWSCKSGEGGCNPTDPLCGGGGGPTVASVTVTSSIDSVVAVAGPMAQMSAEARDANNNPVSGLTFTWASTNTATATVNASSGLVTALAAGTTTIRASQDTNAVTGQLRIRAVDADLGALTEAVGDPFVEALRSALSSTPAGTLSGLLNTCAGHATSGNVRALDGCLADLTSASGSDGNDDALLGVLALFFAHARRQLQL